MCSESDALYLTTYVSARPNAMETLDDLLAEAATFHARLTADIHVSSLERHLRENLAPLDLSAASPFAHVCATPGIYYLEARFSFRSYDNLLAFGEKWGAAKARDLPKSLPRFYVGRARMQKKLLAQGEFIPFYLGKEMNVQGRLTGHLDGELDTSTYALKLRSRAGLLSEVDLRFSFVEIPVQEPAYFCVGLLEKALRNRLHPIIGRQ